MSPAVPAPSRPFGPAALATAAAVTAFLVGGRATRDALFLSSFPATLLPTMVMATAVVSLALAYAATRALSRWGPDRFLHAAFAASAVLLLVEWGVSLAARPAAAVIVYLHFGGLGAILVSGFWSLLNERLDPRTAKRQLGRIAGAGTAGGLVGGFVAAQVGRALPVNAMLPVLAVVHVLCAVGMTRLRGAGEMGSGVRLAEAPSRSGIRTLASSSYLRGLVALVVLLTVAEVLIDLALKSRASAAYTHGELLRFFAAFYTGTALLTALIQVVASGFVLERLGPARSAAVVPAVSAAAAVGGLAAPGLSSAVVARGSESVLVSSLYRAGYEVLFTPVPARDKRAVKSLVDVGASRAGDLLGAAIAQGVVMALAPAKETILFAIAAGLFAIAFLVAVRLQRGYVDALERGLVSRAVRLEIADATDSITRSTVLRTLGLPRAVVDRARRGEPSAGTPPSAGARSGRPPSAGAQPSARPPSAGPPRTGPEESGPSERRLAGLLRSSDPTAVRQALAGAPLSEELLPEVTTLLAWDEVAREAIHALRAAGPQAIEPLLRCLLDPDADFAIRRRIPLVLGTISDPRAVDGLLRALADRRFEVRYRSGRALAHLQALDAALTAPPEPVLAAILREVETSSGVWEGRNLLDRMDDESWSPVMDELVRERAGRSLEHVFTLLALVYPRAPLRIAFRGLHTDDSMLRGTALEFLETTLPPPIRKALWPYLERDADRGRRRGRTKDEALTELLRMNQSIQVRLEELRGQK